MAKSHTNGHELLPHGTAASFSPSNRLPLLIWQLCNDLLNRIQRRWMCFARTAVFSRARRWRGLLSQSHFFWSPDAEGTFHSTHITQLALFQPFQKTGIASVSCISQNHFERHRALVVLDQSAGGRSRVSFVLGPHLARELVHGAWYLRSMTEARYN